MPIYKAFDKFLIRTPLLPFSEKNNELNYQDNLFREGIYIASRTLYEEMLKYESNSLKNEKERKKLESTLKKYKMRMQTRTTPFGLFSGVAVCETTPEDSEIVFGNKITRKARLDMAVVCSIVELLEKDTVIGNEIFYYPNDSIYSIDSKLRYLENKLDKNRYILEISSVDKSYYLHKILQKSKNGISKKAIVEYVASLDDSLSVEDIYDFVTECIESRLFISELTPSLTQPDNILAILETLKARISQDHIIISTLDSICKDIQTINSSDTGVNTIPLYESVIENLKKFEIDFDYNKIFQVDTFAQYNSAKLSKKVINEVMDAVNFCISISPAAHPHTNITEFKTKFYERYEDREVDLIKVMDNDIGIGYPSKHDDYTNSLIKNFYIPSQNNQQNFKVWNSKYEGILINKILDSVRSGTNEVVLKKDDFDKNEDNFLHTTASCFFEILDDDLIFLSFFGDNSGAKMMSRFSHLHHDINHVVKNISLYEEQVNANTLNAELYYLPNPRTGNVMIRPKDMRKYEITCLSKSSKEEEFQIPISDLTISIRNNRIVIKSRKLKKEIKIYHTNAYNYSLADLPIFKFLGDLQYQDKLMTAFQLPDFELDYTPRIRYKNVIISLAKWNINVQKFKKDNPDVTQDNVLIKFKKYYNLPNEIVQAYGDNELYINLIQEDYASILWDLIDKTNFFMVKEFIFKENCGAVKDLNDNVYRNQFNLSLYKS